MTTPTTTPTAPAATKARIISHMNKDHTTSLTLYLRHYAAIPADAITAPLLTDISLSAMTIQSAPGKTHVIPFEPALEEWGGVRGVVVGMDAEARAALGEEVVEHKEVYDGGEGKKRVLDRYLFPMGAQWAVLAVILLFLLNLGLQSYIVPGSWVYEFLESWFPGGGEGYKLALRWAAVIFGVLHLGELVVLDGKLRRVGVVRGGGLWWVWVGCGLVEGFGGIVRVGEWEGGRGKGKKE